MKGQNPKTRMKESHARVRAMTPDEKKALLDTELPPMGKGCSKCRYVGCGNCSGQDIV